MFRQKPGDQKSADDKEHVHPDIAESGQMMGHIFGGMQEFSTGELNAAIGIIIKPASWPTINFLNIKKEFYFLKCPFLAKLNLV